MKPVYFFMLLCFAVIAGCHRKMHLGKTTTTTVNTPVKPLLDSTEAAGGTTATITAPVPAAARPMIIVDAHGNFAVTAKDLPPGASKSILDNENARAYTPAELKTLSYRYKQIPPRILYVPTSLQKSNSRGTYYILLKKFYYWKKPNGYFYLDEHYYQ